MRKNMVLLGLFALSFACDLSAQDSVRSSSTRRHQLGVRLSSQDAVVNNSISYKYLLDNRTAVEGLLSFGDPLALGVLVQRHTPFAASGLTWYWGVGVYTGFGGGRRVGAHGVAGLDYTLPTVPLNLSIDWKPELNFVRQFSFEPAAVGFSARFVF